MQLIVSTESECIETINWMKNLIKYVYAQFFQRWSQYLKNLFDKLNSADIFQLVEHNLFLL